MSEWTVDTLRADLLARLEAIDARHHARADAAELAIAKAETAAEKRFEGVNEFRASLADQQRTLMPRVEAEIRLNALDRHLDEIDNRLGAIESKSKGFAGGWGVAVGVVGLIGAVVAIILSLQR